MTTIKKISKKQILRAVEELNKGKLISFPTETVYGLGAEATNDVAIAKIFKCKNRPKFNPIIAHFSTIKEIENHCEVSKEVKRIGLKFWPGPLTIILKRKESSSLSLLLSAGLDTLAVRIPNNKVALELIRNLKSPIAAPSANKSGFLSPTKANHVYNYFKNEKDLSLILDGGQTSVGVESTIITFEKNQITILRHGGITKEDLETKLTYKVIDRSNQKNQKIISPGLTQNHYSPSVPLRINAKRANRDEILIGFGPKFKEPNLSVSGDLTEAAANLFSILAKLEKEFKKIAITSIPKKGIGKAINDRIKRASNN